MSILSKLADLFSAKKEDKINASYVNTYYEQRNAFTVSYTGEKNLGELGPLKDYYPNYDLLRMRSWQAYFESEIAQTVLNKFASWIIGSGLKLQAEPEVDALLSEGIKLDSESFSDSIESRWKVFAKSRKSSLSNMSNINTLAYKAFLNAIIGGDCLVILRYEGDWVTAQLVDGAHIRSPFFADPFFAQATANGNIIKNGVELNEKGEHVAYYVYTMNLQFERIPAKGDESGMLMAFMVYGLEYRLDNCRGIPLIAVVMETLKKMERYQEATIGSAEERQKIPYFIERTKNATDESPFLNRLGRAINSDTERQDVPFTADGKAIADNIAVTTNKQVFDLPLDTTIKSFDSKNEIYFKDFFTTYINLVCSACSIPPEVAMSKYDSNFSASRAALKDWEHIININRNKFSFYFYDPIYTFWLHTEILKNKIKGSAGYLKAFVTRNDFVLEAFRIARFIGTPVPHIDPLKEVAAERLKLGDAGASLPLTTAEKATENLNSGDSDSNLKQFAAELEESIKLKVTDPAIDAKQTKAPAVPV